VKRLLSGSVKTLPETKTGLIYLMPSWLHEKGRYIAHKWPDDVSAAIEAGGICRDSGAAIGVNKRRTDPHIQIINLWIFRENTKIQSVRHAFIVSLPGCLGKHALLRI
jgi:hypothetical protein